MQAILDPAIEEWLDHDTELFIANELNEAASCYLAYLQDVCGADDLFDVGRAHREWCDEQVRSHRNALVRTVNPPMNSWHEDFELESRRQEAFLYATTYDLF